MRRILASCLFACFCTYCYFFLLQSTGWPTASAESLASSSEFGQIKGIHLDIEPHLLDQWNADGNATANNFLDILQKLKDQLNGTGLMLTADIPFWYDTVNVSRNASPGFRPLNELVADIVDRIGLMDYRDWADQRDVNGWFAFQNKQWWDEGGGFGPVAKKLNQYYKEFTMYLLEAVQGRTDGMTENALQEFAYAEAIGKKVVVLAETVCTQTAPLVSYCGYVPQYLENQLQLVREHYKPSAAYDGIGIHDHIGWQALTPDYTIKSSCGVVRDVFEWEDEPSGNETYFRWLTDHAVRTIYLNVKYRLQWNKAALLKYLQDAYAAKLSVEFLFGNPTWALPENHQAALNLTATALEFVKSQPSVKPVPSACG